MVVRLNRPISRADLERFNAALAEKRRRIAKAEHQTRGYRDEDGGWQAGLLSFVRYFWHVLEPGTPFVDGWVLEAICEHLEAVTYGEITNLLINVFPGAMKSLLTNVFWPAWEWGAMDLAHLRYVTFSYSSSNTERDNQRFGDLVSSPDYQAMYPHVVIRQNGMTMVSNRKHGWKLASSVTGSVTGKRGNRAICDDLNNVKESESKAVMDETNRWFRESLSSRLNSMETDAKIVISQRVSEADVSGEILRLQLPYCHLCIPMEYVWQADDNGEPYTTQIGWVDPRWRPNQEDCEGELAWTDRFSERSVQSLKIELGPYATASQLQQTPEARGGGLIKREWWMPAEIYMTGRKFPPFDYIVASLDGAYTEEEKNDPSALTIWGVFQNEHGYNRAMLVHAWSKRLEFSGPKIDILPNEHESTYKLRARPFWGLIEWVADSCNRFKADKLLIESKASGISAAQSLRNAHGRQGWTIQLVEPKGDKMARGMAIVPSFSQEMIYAPDPEEFDYAGKVIDECALFPYGTHDDLFDSMTQAIKHLRDTGLIRSDEERRAQELDAVRHRGAPKKPMYPGFSRRSA
jgi:predicted phage terminase large subunit-like protein